MLATTIRSTPEIFVNTDLRVLNILNGAFFHISLENDSRKDKNFGMKIWLNWESFESWKRSRPRLFKRFGATNCPRLYIFWSVRRRPKLESPLPTILPSVASLCSSPGCNFSIGADIRSTSVFVSSRVVHVPLSLTLSSFLPSFVPRWYCRSNRVVVVFPR